MYIQNFFKPRRGKVRPDIAELAVPVSKQRLCEMVEILSIPRNYGWERENNQKIGRWIFEQFSNLGLKTRFEGQYDNVVAMTKTALDSPSILIGAHYDSVPGCPGADDNASAVAAMLHAAELLSHIRPELPLCFAAFNREEDGLLGSAELVKGFLRQGPLEIRLAHVLEMVGYQDPRPGRQTLPRGLPIRLPEAGDFLLLIANRHSRRHVTRVLRTARGYLPRFSIMGLKVYFRLEKLFPVLLRSDHASFWEHNIPALLWTDTSEFRNPHYHRESDTPDTLDYDFLKQVTQLLVVSTASELGARTQLRTINRPDV